MDRSRQPAATFRAPFFCHIGTLNFAMLSDTVVKEGSVALWRVETKVVEEMSIATEPSANHCPVARLQNANTMVEGFAIAVSPLHVWQATPGQHVEREFERIVYLDVSQGLHVVDQDDLRDGEAGLFPRVDIVLRH